MNKASFARLILGLWLTGLARAAEGGVTAPPPTAPFVAAPQPETHWEMRIDYQPDTPPPTGPGAVPQSPPDNFSHPTSITCWRDTRLGRILVTWNDGKETEGYIAGNSVFLKEPNGVATVQAADGGDIAASAFYARGYPGTSWITLANYQGVEVINGKPCYKFHRDGVYTTDVSTPDMTAWIEVDGKTPVRLLLGHVECDYSAITPWGGTIELPADVRAKMEVATQEDRALELLRRMNSPPGAAR